MRCVPVLDDAEAGPVGAASLDDDNDASVLRRVVAGRNVLVVAAVVVMPPAVVVVVVDTDAAPTIRTPTTPSVFVACE